MSIGKYFHSFLNAFIVPFLFVLIFWTVFWIELEFGWELKKLGVFPRTLKGLVGIVFSPVLHSTIEHLYSNTLPVLILGTTLFYFYKPISWRVFFLGYILSGTLLWLIGRPVYHIGASGLIYMVVSFLLFKGFFSNDRRLIAVSFTAVFIYGGLFGIFFPLKKKYLGRAICRVL